MMLTTQTDLEIADCDCHYLGRKDPRIARVRAHAAWIEALAPDLKRAHAEHDVDAAARLATMVVAYAPSVIADLPSDPRWTCASYQCRENAFLGDSALLGKFVAAGFDVFIAKECMDDKKAALRVAFPEMDDANAPRPDNLDDCVIYRLSFDHYGRWAWTDYLPGNIALDGSELPDADADAAYDRARYRYTISDREQAELTDEEMVSEMKAGLARERATKGVLDHLKKIDTRDLFEWHWADDPSRRADRQCRHRLIDPSGHCTKCGAGGPKLEVVEARFGHTLAENPIELLGELEKDLLRPVLAEPTAAEPFADRFQTLDEFLSGPSIEYFIDGILPRADQVIWFGDSATGKSFLTIDQGMCIAAGFPWHGHDVQRAKVLFVVGEGVAGYRARIKAWCNRHAIDPASLKEWVRVLPAPVDLYTANGDVGAFVQDVNALGYDLIIFDTLSRMMGAGDEDKARDINVILNNTKDIRGMKGYVHHATKDAATYRGSGNLKASSDTMIRVEKVVKGKDKIVTLSCFKQKDADEFASIKFKITEEKPAAVLVPVTGSAAVSLTESEQKVADAVRAGHATSKAIVAQTGVPKSTVTRALKTLVTKCVLDHDGQQYTIKETE
jgi:hypothetical protein